MCSVAIYESNHAFEFRTTSVAPFYTIRPLVSIAAMTSDFHNDNRSDFLENRKENLYDLHLTFCKFENYAKIPWRK